MRTSSAKAGTRRQTRARRSPSKRSVTGPSEVQLSLKSLRTPQPNATRAQKRAGVRAQKAAARREAILAAALDEFSAQGFAAARLDDVARRAGVAKGTIYLHFRDKETLFQEIIRSVLSPLVGMLEGIAQADAPLRSLAERIVDVFVNEIYATRRKDVIRLIIPEGPRFRHLAEFYYREVLSRVIRAMRGLLRHAIDRGELDNEAILRFPELLRDPARVPV